MKKNIPLIIAFLIPIFMVIFVFASIYLPRESTPPKYNFLYATGGDYYYSSKYVVKNNKLSIQQPNYPRSYTLPSEEQLYIYDIHKQKATQIAFNKAEKLFLNPNKKSSDEFTISQGKRSTTLFPFFIFADDDFNTYYIQRHHYAKRLDLTLSGGAFNNFKFLGWIGDGQNNTVKQR